MGPHELAVILVVAKVSTLAFGGALTYLSYSAFRRTNSRALRALAFGIGLLTLGALLGGLLHQFAGISLAASVTVQSVFTAGGFAVMTYSLFADVIGSDDRTYSATRTGD